MAALREEPWCRNMIRIPAVDEPADFDRRVRRPGRIFLNDHPNGPTNRDYQGHTYWTRAHSQLYDSYAGICAYCASWVPRAGHQVPSLHSSVDHFIPRVEEPRLAFEWTNFRIARRDLNESKGESTEVIDPMHIADDWFELDFTTCRIKAAPAAHAIAKPRIARTVQLLRLNDSPLIDERMGIIGHFAHERIDMATIQRLFPFIAREIARQNVEVTLKPALQAVHP